MRTITLILALYMTVNTNAQLEYGKATTLKNTFSRTTSIQQVIKTNSSVVWALLTDASNYSTWNSTIVSIDGNIAAGEKIKLKSTLDSSRTFKLKVKVFIPNKTLVWGDAMGQRTYSLEQGNDGSTVLIMTEKIGGLMFPLFANKIPSFDASFEQFVADLKKEAESK